MSKKILITGAGSGFGEGTAIGLAQNGHEIIATAQTWPQVTALRAKADPFDSPKKVVVGEVLNRIDGLSHSKIITDPRFSFANSALLFAFNSRLPAQIRK